MHPALGPSLDPQAFVDETGATWRDSESSSLWNASKSILLGKMDLMSNALNPPAMHALHRPSRQAADATSSSP